MKIMFTKYQGTGNDFIIIDDRLNSFNVDNQSFIAQLCHRRFGIGADGLMLLRNHPEYDFEMLYYNADGATSSMCGNGGRCIAHFANSLGIGNGKTLIFNAIDGLHHAEILADNRIALGMNKVSKVLKHSENSFELDTGSPHYVRICSLNKVDDFIKDAKAIRYNSDYKIKGINVNFIDFNDNEVTIRTYERGVEDETFSCGTGAVAAAIVASINHYKSHNNNEIILNTKGGKLKVSLKLEGETFDNIILEGEAQPVFTGVVQY